MEALPWASLGVGGILAGMMFFFYRQDRLEARERWTEILAASQRLLERMDKNADERLKAALDDGRETRKVLTTLSNLVRDKV